jgi:integrase
VIETAIATGARISEILGLTWRNVNLEDGVIQIVQRNWRGDIDDPKSKDEQTAAHVGISD